MFNELTWVWLVAAVEGGAISSSKARWLQKNTHNLPLLVQRNSILKSLALQYASCILTKNSQFCQSIAGTQHSADMNGGCWSCSFYTSDRTCYLLEVWKVILVRRIFQIVVMKSKNLSWVNPPILFNAYKRSCERRRHRTWASCSSDP